MEGKIRLWLLHIAVIDGIFFPDVLISRWSWRINFEHGTLAIVENGVSNVATGNRLWEELDMVHWSHGPILYKLDISVQSCLIAQARVFQSISHHCSVKLSPLAFVQNFSMLILTVDFHVIGQQSFAQNVLLTSDSLASIEFTVTLLQHSMAKR